MQPATGQLSNGFITIPEAIKIINSDKREDAAVDLDWMAKNIDWIQEFKNFKIPVARNITEEEIKDFMEKHPGKRPPAITLLEPLYVYVASVYEKETLKHAIKEAWKARVGRELADIKTKNKTTVYDPEHNTLAQGGTAIQFNPNPTTKAGDDLGRGETL